MWTFGWILVANLAVEHLAASGGDAALFNVMVAIAGIMFGCLETFWFYPRKPGISSSNPSPPEPWYRRAMGWFGATVWCLAGVVWNLAVFGTLARSATKGQSLNFVIMIPFSLIGMFLLLALFVGITLVMDTVFRLGDVTPPSPPTEPAVQPPQLSPAPSAGSANEFDLMKSPILGSLLIITFLNWFLFVGISLHLGGDAVGVLPSADGFMVKSHGHHTAVSESAWVFSLYYSTATLLLSPLVVLIFAARQMGGRLLKTGKWPLKLFIGAFLLVWVVGWYSSIGSAFLRSLEDWQKLKHPTPALEPSRQTPAARPDAVIGVPANVQK